jgi:hypothetical protein
MRTLPIIAAAAAAALAGCTQAPPPSAYGPQADQRLQAMLTGKVAAPSGCIPQYRAGRPSLVTPGAIAFQVDPGLVYVSNVQGTGCEDLANPNFAMVTNSNGPGLCSGDTVRIYDVHTRVLEGACTLGPIVAYSGH